MWSLSARRVALTTWPHGIPSSMMTDVRSLRSAASSAAGDGPAKSNTSGNIRAKARAGVIKTFLLESAYRIEFFLIREDGPDRFARPRDRAGQGWIAILDEGEHLEDQHVVRLPQRGDAGLLIALVMRPELFQQVIHLVLERELGENADGMRLPQPRFQ